MLQSIEKMPNVNLVEKGCSESFHGETIYYLSLQRSEEDIRHPEKQPNSSKGGRKKYKRQKKRQKRES